MKQEICPICGAKCSVPELQFNANGKGYREPIACQCGAWLKVVVPFFKVTESGLKLVTVKPPRK